MRLAPKLPSARRLLSTEALLCVMPVALVAGAWMVASAAVDHLLHHDAEMTGQGWATYLAENVRDLDPIAVGLKPSEESQRFFERVQKVGQVFRYVVYDPEGHERLASNTVGDDEDEEEDKDGANPHAVRAVATGAPVVNAEEGEEDEGRPSYFAEAYVPVIADGRPVAVVETYVDQSEKRAAYRTTLVVMGAGLIGLMVVSFGVPVLAWQRRGREKRLADAHVTYLARHDALTGLLNRASLAGAVGAALAARTAPALHAVDIDHFKDINDTLGHEAGDALVTAVADRLRAAIGAGDHVARVGGDEFVVLQGAPADEAAASALAGAMVRDLARPFELNGHTVSVSASVGVAVAPRHGTDMTRLMKSADLALYRSKATGRGRATVFSPDMDDELAERLRLERAVRGALEHERFELHFQPSVEMPARRLVGFEALVRMRDEAGTLISPVTFIPLAERMGLIETIGTWVLREACRVASAWPDHLKVAVNLSPAQLTSGHLVDIVAAALADTGLPPGRLELEITEGMLLDDSEGIMAELRRLKEIGVDIVMDDFGTGYSSLSYLWKFPFDKIKIDRAFMVALEQPAHEDASAVVRTIIGLGRSLHMAVTVEGVETETQAAFVEAAGGNQIQGYYFGRPMPVDLLAGHILRDTLADTRPTSLPEHAGDARGAA